MTLENIDKVHDIILAKTLVEMRESAKAVGILIDRVKWRNIGLSALNFEEIISKNEVRYETKISVFHIEPSYLSNHPRE